jgi:hypothetical protein
MRKIILIVFLLIPMSINAGEIVFCEVSNVLQYSQIQELKTKAKNFLKNQSQPAEMFGYNYFPINDILIFWGNKQILMNIDIIINGYESNKIETIGIRKYNKNGYIRDAEFYLINNRIKELNRYEIEISTL